MQVNNMYRVGYGRFQRSAHKNSCSCCVDVGVLDHKKAHVKRKLTPLVAPTARAWALGCSDNDFFIHFEVEQAKSVAEKRRNSIARPSVLHSNESDKKCRWFGFLKISTLYRFKLRMKKMGLRCRYTLMSMQVVALIRRQTREKLTKNIPPRRTY